MIPSRAAWLSEKPNQTQQNRQRKHRDVELAGVKTGRHVIRLREGSGFPVHQLTYSFSLNVSIYKLGTNRMFGGCTVLRMK